MNASYIFHGEITEESTLNFLSFLNSCKFSPSVVPDYITVYMNSVGGDISCASAIIHAIEHSEIPIHIVGIGMLASAAFQIFYFTENCIKSIMPTAYALIHIATTSIDDRDTRKPSSYSNVVKKYLDLINDQYVEKIKKNKILTSAQLKKVNQGEDVTLGQEDLYRIMLKCPYGIFLKEGEEIIIEEKTK